MKKGFLINIVGIVAVLMFALSDSIPASASTLATIDFGGLAEGAIISKVSSGNGISGDPVNGFVEVFFLMTLSLYGSKKLIIFFNLFFSFRLIMFLAKKKTAKKQFI